MVHDRSSGRHVPQIAAKIDRKGVKTMEKALEKGKALQPYNKQGMDTITQHKQQMILAIIQDMIDTYGTAENALAAIGKMPVPNSQIRGAKFLKRALRILIRAEKGLEIHAKRGTTV